MALAAILLRVALVQLSETEAASVNVQIVEPADFRSWGFSPNPVQATVGDTITWTNTGSAGHTVTADQGAFNSGNVAPGGRFTFTATAPGVLAYHCDFHPGMRGTLTIQAAPVPEPLPSPAPVPEPGPPPAAADPMPPAALVDPQPVELEEPVEPAPVDGVEAEGM